MGFVIQLVIKLKTEQSHRQEASRGCVSPNGALVYDGAQPWPALWSQTTVAQTEGLKPLVVLQARENTLNFFISKSKKK